MFGIFKSDPVKKLNKQLSAKLEEAMHAQRRGDIRSYSEATAEAEKMENQIKELEKSLEK